MKRHDDSQRSGWRPVMFGDVRVVDRVSAAIASLPRPGFDGSMMKRHDDSQRSGRTEKQLTAPADRPVRESAHAVAFTTDVAIRGAGSVHRRTGMRTARALPGGSGRPGSPPAIPPALTAIQTRCFAHHHPMVAHHPLCRCQAGADVRRAHGSIPGPHVPLSTLHPRPCEWRRMTRGRRGSLALRRMTLSSTTTLPVFAGAQEVHMTLKEPHGRVA